jgi:hypothetical protein
MLSLTGCLCTPCAQRTDQQTRDRPAPLLPYRHGDRSHEDARASPINAQQHAAGLMPASHVRLMCAAGSHVAGLLWRPFIERGSQHYRPLCLLPAGLHVQDLERELLALRTQLVHWAVPRPPRALRLTSTGPSTDPSPSPSPSTGPSPSPSPSTGPSTCPGPDPSPSPSPSAGTGTGTGTGKRM